MQSITPLRSALLRSSRLSSPILANKLHTSRRLRLPYKDDQDRESLKPKSSEYSRSGTDDQSAANEDAAFNPNKTRPEQEKDMAGQQPTHNGNNPLEVSPANQDVAKSGAGKQEDTAKTSSRRRSGGGSGPKGGKVN